jgi:hypothetical protein
VGSNPAEVTDVCLRLLCCDVLRWTDPPHPKIPVSFRLVGW